MGFKKKKKVFPLTLFFVNDQGYLYVFNVLGKHCLMFAFLAFQLGLFLEVVVTYPSTFCVTPNGSLF